MAKKTGGPFPDQLYIYDDAVQLRDDANEWFPRIAGLRAVANGDATDWPIGISKLGR